MLVNKQNLRIKILILLDWILYIIERNQQKYNNDEKVYQYLEFVELMILFKNINS